MNNPFKLDGRVQGNNAILSKTAHKPAKVCDQIHCIQYGLCESLFAKQNIWSLLSRLNPWRGDTVDSYIHTSSIHIIPVSHKNYSWGN